MYAYPGITQTQTYTPPTGCNVPECREYIKLFHAKGEPGKCLCSSTRKDKTGEPGCPGFKDRPKFNLEVSTNEKQQRADNQ